MPFDDLQNGRFQPTPGPLDPRFQPVATIQEGVSTQTTVTKAMNILIYPASAARNLTIVAI